MMCVLWNNNAMENKIVDFYTGDHMTQGEAEAVLQDPFGNDDRCKSRGYLANALNDLGYKMIHIDDMIEQCVTVEEVKIVKRIFDLMPCELFDEPEVVNYD